jgi:putative addiction module component (TIGR02574 family)
MRRRADSVLREALTLPESERAVIGGALLESLEHQQPEADVEMAWRQEVATRVAAPEAGEAGEAETTPWEEIREGILARLSERRQG